MLRPRSRPALAALPLLLVGLVACGAIQTAVCGLSDYAVELKGELEALGDLDPELVAQPGTPENAAALAAIDELDATRTAAQEALDATSEDEVGPVVRTAFQAALDATETAAANLRSAVEAGDAAAVGEAIGQVQRATEAIDAFLEVADGLNVDCDASPTASEVSGSSAAASATAEPTRQPRPTPTATPEPTATPSPTAEPSPTVTPSPSPTPAETPSPTPSPSPTPTSSPSASPTSTPSPTPTSTPTPSPTASESPEPSPAPSAEAGENGAGPLVWVAVLGALGAGAAALFLWGRSRTSDEAPDEPGEPGDLTPPEDLPSGGPPPAVPPTQSG